MIAFTEIYPQFDGKIKTVEGLELDNGELVSVNAQWDCGATYSSISTELAKQLMLNPIGRGNVDSTNGKMLSNIYKLKIVLHKDNVFIPVMASESTNIHQSDVDLLIGMDVIYKGDFSISTYGGITCFSFRYPSKGLIDFTKL